MKSPVRAFRLTLKLDADSREELVSALINLASHTDRGEITTGVRGGPSSGSIYELLSDPDKTHEMYFQEVRDYLDAINTQKDMP